MVDGSRLIVGADGCKGGWIAVFHPADAREKLEMRFFPTFAALAEALPQDAIIGIDMPIGLPEQVGAGGRAPDRAARAVLGPRRSSVFSVPSRRAVFAFEQGYPEVCRIARETSEPPWAPSKQSFWLFPRIQQIDIALRADAALEARVFEVHPEVAFRLMQGAPLEHPKKKRGRCFEAGMALRRKLLANEGFAPGIFTQARPRGAGLDDLLDACAVAWSAARIMYGTALLFPPPDADGKVARDAMGMRVAIWA